MRVLVLNGPDVGRLGRRQPESYGATTYAELADLRVARAAGQRPEVFRHTSYIEPHAATTISGEGIDGYRLALEHLASDERLPEAA